MIQTSVMHLPTNKRINILFVIMQMAMGGSERLVHNLISKLDRSRFNPSLAWFEGDEIHEEFASLNIPLYHIRKSKRIDMQTMVELASIIRDNRIHVVNAHHFMPFVYSFYGSSLRNNARLFFTAHSVWEISNLPLKWRVLGSLLVRRSGGFIGVSDNISNAAEKIFWIDKNKIFTIESGININNHDRGGRRRRIRKSLGLSDNDTVIGIVANLTRIKNHMFLLRGFREVARQHPDARLLLIGRGFDENTGIFESTETEIRRYIQEQGLKTQVHLLGYRSDVKDILCALDIFCLTSMKEGLPISLLEAMATGLPVIGTDVAGIRDVIKNGKNGLLVDSNDVAGLSDALNLLIKNEQIREEFGRYSEALVRERYAFDKCLKYYEKLFGAMITNNAESAASR